ncbi:MAG TPA: hypothetical protein DD435_06215, partial [Cyanobacteria bacterium UBA8530]|nr:hypothetical protein [Cyanobacteria bacterium UBA8530]
MRSEPDSSERPSFALFSRLAAASSLSFGCLVLIGWLFEIPFLKSVLPGWPSMQANSAIAFVLLGGSLLLGKNTRLARGLAALVFLLATSTLIEHLFFLDLGIDHWLLLKPIGATRICLVSSLSFAFLGASLLFSELRLAPFLALPPGLIGLWVIMGYAYGASLLLGFPHSPNMPFNTALNFLLLGIGILCSDTRKGFMAIAASDGPGSVVLRRLLPGLLILMLALGWVVPFGESFGLYGRSTGNTLLFLFLIVVAISVALAVSGDLHRMDEVRKKAEEERNLLQEAQIETLLQADRLKDEFLSVISHELRTPLNAIMGFGSLLNDGVAGDLNECQRSFVAKILDGSDRMLKLINSLLEFARMRAGKFEIEKKEASYRETVEEALDFARPTALEKGLSFFSEIKVEERVFIDEQRIFQVLSNLISNAIKFTPQDGKVFVKAFVVDDRLVTEVSDDGIGIAPDSLEGVFELFAQVGTGTDGGHGLGIGLFLVRNVIEMHGGRVTAASAGAGKGSCFTVALPPDVLEGRVPAPPAGSASAPAPTPDSPRRFLVVDDNADAAVTLAMLLEMLGHTVSVAHSGEEALAAVGAFAPDIVVLDIGMPGMDGY